jgi:hypothetical protein
MDMCTEALILVSTINKAIAKLAIASSSSYIEVLLFARVSGFPRALRTAGFVDARTGR